MRYGTPCPISLRGIATVIVPRPTQSRPSRIYTADANSIMGCRKNLLPLLSLDTFPQEPTMTISLYASSVPVFKHILGSLSAILDKAQAHATAKKIEPSALLQARLFPDMFIMRRQ